MTTRRQFIGGSAALIGAASARATSMLQPAENKLSILFLGGTGFIGPHQINYALDRGHEVTMFNRGNNSGLYGGRVEELIGDRDANVNDGLKSLQGDRTWDVVVDNSGYVPRHVRDSAELLKDRCDRYIYTSTVAVYDFEKTPVVNNQSPLYSDFPDTEEVTWETYGPLKAECDLIVQDIYSDRATIVRPTYVVGPGDRTDRFTYWVDRFHRGGDIVCPAGPDLEVNFIDVRDLCHWLVSLGETGTPGIFNASGPATAMSNLELMLGLRAFTAGEVKLHWPDHELLSEMEFNTPMFEWTPYSMHIDASAAIAAGMPYTSLADTVRDTYEWWTTESEERRANARGWPSADEEQAVLAKMRS